MNTAQWRELGFKEATQLWLELKRKENLADKTLHEYGLNVNTLLKFFQPFKLAEIASEHLAEYQERRKTEGVGYSALSHECSVLQQILKMGNLWDDIQPFFRPPRKPKWKPGRVISEADQQRLLRYAQENASWEGVFYFAGISLNTSCGPGEVLHLRLQDLHEDDKIPTFFVSEEGAKNHERVRPVVLNEEAVRLVKQARERACRLGAISPDHYLFPYRAKRTRKYDATKHQTEYKWAWKNLIQAAGLPGLKMYDLRRTWITGKLNDHRVAVETIVKQAGHVGAQTIKHYSYNRLDKMHQMVSVDDKPKPRQKKPQHKVWVSVEREKAAEARSDAKSENLNPQSFTWGKYWRIN